MMRKGIRLKLLFGAVILANLVFLNSCNDDLDDTSLGLSTLMSIQPATGILNWGYYFSSEDVEAIEHRNDGQQVVVRVSDPCWNADLYYAFDVLTGASVALATAETNDNTTQSICDALNTDTVTGLKPVGDLCVGLSEATQALVALDSLTGGEKWRFEQPFEDFLVVDDHLFLTALSAADPKPHRLVAIALETGTPKWQFSSATAIHLLGVKEQVAVVFSMHIYGLSAENGSENWMSASRFNHARIIDEVLYVSKTEHYSSCMDSSNNDPVDAGNDTDGIQDSGTNDDALDGGTNDDILDGGTDGGAI